jgi:3-hydroxybutyryl-CoA dehydrogenase
MKIRNIGVVGSGSMGSAIAEVMAFNGYQVTMRDVDDKVLARGMGRIQKILDDLVAFHSARTGKEIARLKKMGIELTTDQLERLKAATKPEFTVESRDSVLSRITPTTSYSSLQESDLVIEAAFENMEVKKDIFSELSKVLSQDAILASNTSSLSITQIAGSYSRPERTIIAHFFNPPYTLPLVEIVPGLNTSPETAESVASFISGLKNHRGKMLPVRVKEVPGFVVNRILVPMMNEAARMLDEGVAAAGDIDAAMKAGAGMPMGPLELSDMVGLDIVKDVMDILYREYGDQKYAPSLLIKRLVNAGKLGRKTEEGFFRY